MRCQAQLTEKVCFSPKFSLVWKNTFKKGEKVRVLGPLLGKLHHHSFESVICGQTGGSKVSDSAVQGQQFTHTVDHLVLCKQGTGF